MPEKKEGSDKQPEKKEPSGAQGEESEAEKPQEENKPVPGSEGQKSEEDIALEQWLQQIPDDPGGLLRRKFMLEHINRQKGGGAPQ